MKRQEATNTFQEGMVMDFNPLTTPNNVVTNCLNGTLITFNGNEYVLQNDMGNGRVETAYLPEGYVPLGTAELGGIIYIVSYNPLTDKSQIGCFPSPERNVTSDEIQTPEITINDVQFRSGRKVTNTIVKVKLLSNPDAEDGIFKLNPGDKYTIFSTNNGISNNKSTISDVLDGDKKTEVGGHKVDTVPKYVTIHVVSIGEDGKITYLDDSLKWTNENGLDYYIKELAYTSKEQAQKDLDSYRTLVTSAYNIFNSKVSGELALLFELKVIDSFSVAWDANVEDIEGDLDKEATITFNLEWTSSSSEINPSHIVLTESSDFGGVTDVTKDKVCILPEYTNRKNDGTDERISTQVGTFKYQSKDELTDYTWNYQVTPSMPFGELDYLAVRGTINFAEIGSGKIAVDEWRYYIQENSFYLNWGLDAYPEKNKRIERVIFTFIPFEKVNTGTIITDEDKEPLDSFPQHEVIGKSSYAGNFQEVINFGKSSKVSQEGLKKNYLYLVDICAKYGNDSGWKYRHSHKWLYTTGQWNEQFLAGVETNFSNLTLDEVLDFKPNFHKSDKIFENTIITELALPDEAPQSSENMIYAAMGSKILTVNYDTENKKFDESVPNVNIDIEVVPSKYAELFQFTLMSNDKFNNEISKNYITHDDFSIDSDSLSVISQYVESKIMPDTGIDKTQIIEAIKSIIENNKVTQTVDPTALDSFGSSIIGDKNAKTVNLNVFGAIFSRINADLWDRTVTVGQRVRPILYETEDAEALGLTMTGTSSISPAMINFFKEGHCDLGGGKPFSFQFGRYKWDGTQEEVPQHSSKGSWDPSDGFTRNYYWDDTPPYTDWLNPWMLQIGGPFQVLQYGANFGNDDWSNASVKAGNTSIKSQYGVWCKTDNGHFVPVQGFTSDKNTLAKYIALLLMQIYYVETDVTPLLRCVIKNINRLKTFIETWNVEISSTLRINEKSQSVGLLDSSEKIISLKTLQDSCSSLDEEQKRNITYNGAHTLNLGSETFSHQFRVNTDDLYLTYENAKSTNITAIRDIITMEDPVTTMASLNANKLYVYEEGTKEFVVLSSKTSECIKTGGTIKTTDGRFLLSNPSGGYKSNEVCDAIKRVDEEIVLDEDRLLRSKINFKYETQEGATYRGNSKYKFIGFSS